MRTTTLLYLLPLILVLFFFSLTAASQPEGGGATPAVSGSAEAPASSAADDQAAAPETGRISLLKVVEWGGYIGYFIIFLSVITVTLVVFHILLCRRSRLWPKAVLMKVGRLFSERKMEEAVDYCEIDNSLLSRVVAGALRRMKGGHVEMEQAMNDSAETEVLRLQQTVGYFSLIAAVAPLCGLLGTVVGMIAAFNEIASRGVVTPRELADPIQKALVTTCFGLIVAIPNVIAFTFFRDYLHRLLADLGVLLDDLMMAFKGVKPEWLEAEKTEPEAPSMMDDEDEDEDSEADD